jgi:flagellar basal-body rod protein FlgF
MDRGLYIAASGMLSELVRQDQISNDLANASTPGYKPDRATQRSFEDLLIDNTRTGERVGSLGLGSQIDSIVTNLSPGPLRQTDEALDYGIDGEGFFALQTPQGVRYTRNGQFTSNADGTLVNSLGYPVLSQGGGTIRVGAGGRVDADAIGVFAVPNAVKQGESLFTGGAAGRATGQARSGVLEGSGAEPARSMVDMIASFRAFEAGQRVIRTLDETLQKATTQVGQI